jgi:hypothetical protein
MKKLYLIPALFLLFGCGGPNDPLNYAKELLTKQDYYSSCTIYSTQDSTIEYIKYSFKDRSYTKIEYSDSNYTKVKNSINDKVEYLSALNVSLYNGISVEDCTVADNGDNRVTLICLNRAPDLNYSVITTLYPTKNKALEVSKNGCN